jgi:hypothetical protein
MIDRVDDEPIESGEDTRPRFRRTLASVMTVQVVTLLCLWWLETHFSP